MTLSGVGNRSDPSTGAAGSDSALGEGDPSTAPSRRDRTAGNPTSTAPTCLPLGAIGMPGAGIRSDREEPSNEVLHLPPRI